MLGRKKFGAVSLAALAAAVTLAPAHEAAAQLVPADPSNSVLIDLGAIDGGAPARGGVAVAPGVAPAPGAGPLLMPPATTPSSRLLGPDGRPIRAPQAATADRPRPAPRIASAPQPTTAPKPKSEPARTAAAEPQKPKLPEVALPTVPAPSPQSEETSGPVALNAAEAPAGSGATMAPTPPPAVTPPSPPQASAPKAPDAAPKTAAKSNGAAKSGAPTPPPAVAPASPTDEPSAAPKPETTQQAALPPQRPAPGAPKAAAPESMEIRFAVGQADLSDEAKATLDRVSADMKADEKSRLQLLAYASEDQISPSKARRLSLSRALAVRSYLINKGIRSTRIDVRALGDQVPSGEPNRVDLKVSDR